MVRRVPIERGTTMDANTNHADHDRAMDDAHDAAVAAALDARVYGTTGLLIDAAAYVARHAGLPMDHCYVIDALTAAGYDTPM